MELDEERPFCILLVEDDPGDARLAIEALRDCNFKLSIHHAPNGESALRSLRKTPGFDEIPRPNLIIMDLNMPIMNGFEALALIKTDAHLADIPVVVMTASREDQDLVKLHRLQADEYLPKPSDVESFDDFREIVEKYAAAQAVQ